MGEDVTDKIVQKFKAYCSANNIVLTDENYDETLRAAVSPEEYDLLNMPDEAHDKITALSAEGDACAERRDYPSALKLYWEAWELLPEPKTDYEAATWLLAAIGDANFLSGDFEAGRDNLSNAMHCPGAIGNPFLHLRLGQCQYELENEARAIDEMTRAMMGGGEEIFGGDNPKYLRFLKTKIKAPAGGWSEGRREQRPWWKFW